MPRRRPAVLLCGQARATLAAIARELARTGAPLVIQAAADSAAARRGRDAGAIGTSGATIVRSALGGETESRRLVTAAWRAARAIDAVVICPVIAGGGASAALPLAEWQNGIDAGLRAPFFVAKHAGLRMQRGGGGRLILAFDASARSGPVGEVVRAGLLCMVDALARALPRRVGVMAVVGTGRGAGADIARGVRLLLDGDFRGGGVLLELGLWTRRG